MTKWKIYNEDAVEWAKNYQKGKFHALFCDAPYHLTSIVKRFGKKNSAPAKHGTDGVFARSSKGFMGTQWDGGDIAFRPETWEAFGEVLYPGAFGMAFSASRNWHRMAVAIEDAGFILHPTIFLWAYGQGFPKATRIDTQIEPKSKQKKVGKYKLPNGQEWNLKQAEDDSVKHAGGTFTASKTRTLDITQPNDEMASRWIGHRYGLQALKPAVEPIIVFQKPYEGKPLDNIVETGAGALNIDATRIPLATGDEYTINEFTDGAKPFGNGAGHPYTSRKVKEDPRLGGKGKWKTDKAAKNVYEGGYEGIDIASSEGGRWPTNLILADSQWNAPESRFFYTVQSQLDESDPVYYCGKVSPKERNAGLDDLDDVKMAVSGGAQGAESRGEDAYLQDHLGYNRIKTVKNPHPTLKPIDLSRYLATLLLPPIDYAPRRIFIPFSGVASEMIGAGLAGWEHVVGVEFDKENGYVDIAEKRLQHWLNK